MTGEPMIATSIAKEVGHGVPDFFGVSGNGC